MKKFRKVIGALSDRVDLPGHITACLPYLTMEGFGEVSIDLQQGLVSYAEEEIVVKVSLGSVCIQGNGLHITLMRQGKITVKGEINAVLLQREMVT